MKELIDWIKENTSLNTKEVESVVLNMYCSEDEPVPLAQDKLLYIYIYIKL